MSSSHHLFLIFFLRSCSFAYMKLLDQNDASALLSNSNLKSSIFFRLARVSDSVWDWVYRDQGSLSPVSHFPFTFFNQTCFLVLLFTLFLLACFGATLLQLISYGCSPNHPIPSMHLISLFDLLLCYSSPFLFFGFFAFK